MGVDGIGNGGRPLPDLAKVANVGGGEVDGVRAAEGASGGEAARGAERSSGSALLDQLRNGEISFDGYLDAQVNAAVSHVQGSLQPGQIDLIREVLREQLAADPVLAELVRRATGSTPPPRVG